MRLQCWYCGKSVSTELPDDVLCGAIAVCPECLDVSDEANKGGMMDFPDIEHCKKLKKVGWELPTEFRIFELESGVYVRHSSSSFNFNSVEWYFAPMLTELWDALPSPLPGTEHRPWMDKHGEITHVGYGDVIEIEDKNPCNALVKLWVWKEERG